jgi:hypothetical protein
MTHFPSRKPQIGVQQRRVQRAQRVQILVGIHPRTRSERTHRGPRQGTGKFCRDLARVRTQSHRMRSHPGTVGQDRRRYGEAKTLPVLRLGLSGIRFRGLGKGRLGRQIFRFEGIRTRVRPVLRQKFRIVQ